MAGNVPPAKIEEIRAASDIVEVVGGYVPLKRAGANFVALCPFHKEKSPSFNVNPQLQIFHCFGCGKGGDVFSFVQEHERIGFLEAVRRLAERSHIDLEFESRDAPPDARFRKETLLKIHEQLAQRWQTTLANDDDAEPAREYLRQRGIDAEAIRIFRIGYAPDAWDDTVHWAKNKGFDLATVEQAGLVIRRERAEGYYGRFRGRLILPIADEQGRVIGFSGRILASDSQSAKYVNSPDTPLFRKGRVIFGLDKARRALLDAGAAIVCEGQFDLIACYMAGVKNVVAPQGTALTGEQCRVLKRYVDEAVLCFDSDAAGHHAAVRALDDLIASGLAVRVATLPASHDPDSYIRERGAESFRELIAKAAGFFDYLLDRLCGEHDLASDRGRAAVLHGMADAVYRTRNEVTIDTYAQKTAQRLGVTVDAVRAEFRKAGRQVRLRSEEPATVETSAEEPAPPPSMHELWLLRLLLMDDENVDFVRRHLAPDWIQHASARLVIETRLHAQAEGTWHSLTQMLSELESDAARRLVAQAVTEKREIANRERQVADVVKRLRDQAIDRRLTPLLRELAEPDLPESRRLELLREQRALRLAKREALKELKP